MTAHQATQDGRLKAKIHPLDGVDHDLLLRPDTSLEKLATLKPVFDRSAAGTITAGNSSPLTDGAAPLVLMSERSAIEEGHEPLAQADRSSRRRRVSRTLPTPGSAWARLARPNQGSDTFESWLPEVCRKNYLRNRRIDPGFSLSVGAKCQPF